MEMFCLDMNLASLVEAFVLAAALSVDAFLAFFAYGSQKIKVPGLSVAVVSLVCGGIFLASLLVGNVIAPYIGARATAVISLVVLSVLGLMRLFDSTLKRWIRGSRNGAGRLEFTALNLRFILNVYADPQIADLDQSQALSPKEAAALSIALSLDGIAAGLGAGVMGVHIEASMIIFVLLTVLAVKGGAALGNRMAEKIPWDVSWVSGVLLICLAVFRFISSGR